MSSSPATIHRDVHAKALALNLDPLIYGTLAEIGAGQEVARWFLSVGAASGTVAKSISAYDKVVSDDIYGAGTRYVSKERLLAMLDCEYRLLLDGLNPARGEATRFFVFADTVAARNYQGTNQQHGWLGIRFQTQPGGEPSQVLVHINLRDSTAPLQHQAIGVLGVNLVYAAFHQTSHVDSFLTGLFDELSIARIEIDEINLKGAAFANRDERAWCLALLRRQMAHAIMFDTQGKAVEPSSVIRKRPLIIQRGSFNHPELFDPELFGAASQLLAEEAPMELDPAMLLELTTHHVGGQASPAVDKMLACIQQLTPEGLVIVTDYRETYLLSRYLRRHSTEPVRFIMGVVSAAKIMHEAFYSNLPGTLLEGVGRLLATNVKIYISPIPAAAVHAEMGDVSRTFSLKESGNSMVTLDDLIPSEPGLHLFKYLRACGRMVPLDQN